MITLLFFAAAVAFLICFVWGYHNGRNYVCNKCDTLTRLLDAEDCVKALDEALEIAHKKNVHALLHDHKN